MGARRPDFADSASRPATQRASVYPGSTYSIHKASGNRRAQAEAPSTAHVIPLTSVGCRCTTYVHGIASCNGASTDGRAFAFPSTASPISSLTRRSRAHTSDGIGASTSVRNCNRFIATRSPA
ncbi:MAG: hypothetical protein BWZ02_03238 [Lentisphaerae bacterium ADurb.BinA184]|nr:MAG: hypothetical protein BWZ02_03238 [Lentisphaerae bacterium ADurb.BinA184]